MDYLYQKKVVQDFKDNTQTYNRLNECKTNEHFFFERGLNELITEIELFKNEKNIWKL